MISHLPRRYFNLNIRHSDEKWCANEFLGRKPMPLAPIFYGERTISELRDAIPGSKSGSGLRAKGLGEAKEFLELHESSQREGFQPVLVTIDSGRVWLYEPIGKPSERERINGFRDKKRNGTVAGDLLGGDGKGQILVKAYDVRHLPMQCRDGKLTTGAEGLPTSEVPLVLSSMKVNQAFSRNTFTEISKGGAGRYKGNIAAIKTVLGESGDGFTVDPLDCLSAVEFETLVAKLFEAQSCFVPAYRGGVMKDVDLYIHNEGAIDSPLVQLRKPDEGNVWSVQLKLSAANDAKSLEEWTRGGSGNILISLDADVPDALVGAREEGRFMGRKGVRDWINSRPAVKSWLDRSLDWLPPKWCKDAG